MVERYRVIEIGGDADDAALRVVADVVDGGEAVLGEVVHDFRVAVVVDAVDEGGACFRDEVGAAVSLDSVHFCLEVAYLLEGFGGDVKLPEVTWDDGAEDVACGGDDKTVSTQEQAVRQVE